jgi:hypothetical protein
LFAIGHKYGMKNMMHMCGCIRPVLRDLIDAGLDIYENLVTNTPNMKLGDLKKEYGQDLVFYGGIDVQYLMPFAKPEEVYEEVSRFIDIAGAGGGLILSTCHYLTDDVPLENITSTLLFSISSLKSSSANPVSVISVLMSLSSANVLTQVLLNFDESNTATTFFADEIIAFLIAGSNGR